MNQKLKEKNKESLAAVLPITVIVLLITVLLVPLELGPVMLFLTGAVLLIVGMGFFQLGAEMAMMPLGEGIGVQISKHRNIIMVLLLGFFMGAIITISEPDLQVLASQVPAVPNMVLILTVASGVGIFLALAILRILFQMPLNRILLVFYALVLLLSVLAPADFLAVAFDAGGVTTGPMTVPFIMTMGVGLASVRSDRKSSDDSFGLVAFSSIGPIMAVLLLGCIYRPETPDYTLDEVTQVSTTKDVVMAFLQELPQYAKEVLISLLPIVGVFLVFQLLTHRYRREQKKRILVGFLYTYIGLVLFLCGVNVGFAPVGTLLGQSMASAQWKWLLVPIGMLIGYYIVKAEPAIQVLNHQVESVTNGAISASSMNSCLSIGVSVSVGLAMLRVLAGIPIYYILIPGYALALILARFVPPIFVGIAFDSGGVASGPMTTTFLLPLSIGACVATGGSIMTDAFGVVALVALTPLIAVQLMGIQYKRKMSAGSVLTGQVAAAGGYGDEIVDLEDY